jgi:hypothetical protein
MLVVRVLVTIAVSAGCVGTSYRGTAGISHGAVDRVIVDAVGGLEARNYTAASDDDRAFLVFWGLGGRIATRLDSGKVSGGPLTGFGASYFRGRYGMVALATVGGLFGDGQSVVGRFQIGFEVEGGTSDWRILEKPPQLCPGYTDTRNVAANRTHNLFALLPGVEYFGGHDGGAAISLSVSFREIIEPERCGGLGP